MDDKQLKKHMISFMLIGYKIFENEVQKNLYRGLYSATTEKEAVKFLGVIKDAFNALSRDSK